MSSYQLERIFFTGPDSLMSGQPFWAYCDRSKVIASEDFGSVVLKGFNVMT
jgi:hypothetical protein